MVILETYLFFIRKSKKDAPDLDENGPQLSTGLVLGESGMCVCTPTTAHAGLGQEENASPGARVTGPAASGGCRTRPLRKTLAGPPVTTQLPVISQARSETNTRDRGPAENLCAGRTTNLERMWGKKQQKLGFSRKSRANPVHTAFLEFVTSRSYTQTELAVKCRCTRTAR